MPAQPAPSTSQSSRAASPPAPAPDQRPRLIAEIKRFWQRVTEGLELGQLMSQFKQDAQTGFRFYRKDFDAGTRSGEQQPSFLHRAQELMWAILGKLTPARRVLLLVGIVLLLLPGGGFQFQRGD